MLARGYDQFKLDVKRHPWREELDRVAPDNPVHLVRTCGHISICNSKAFELAGITAATPAPPGGLIEVQNGQLTGMLAENGRDPIRKVLPAATDEELVGAIERAGQYLQLARHHQLHGCGGRHAQPLPRDRRLFRRRAQRPAAGAHLHVPARRSGAEEHRAGLPSGRARHRHRRTTCCASGR